MEFSFSDEIFLKCNFESDNFESKVGQLSPADAEFYLWCGSQRASVSE